MVSGVREESERIAEAGERGHGQGEVVRGQGGDRSRDRGRGWWSLAASTVQDNRFSNPGAETRQEEALQGRCARLLKCLHTGKALLLPSGTRRKEEVLYQSKISQSTLRKDWLGVLDSFQNMEVWARRFKLREGRNMWLFLWDQRKGHEGQYHLQDW